jgi:tryptophanyl-tRNA synthetase
VLVEFITPIQASVKSYLDDTAELDKLLAKGAERAREVASETLKQVYDRVGFLA